jgi:hypothetical protein
VNRPPGNGEGGVSLAFLKRAKIEEMTRSWKKSLAGLKGVLG